MDLDDDDDDRDTLWMGNETCLFLRTDSHLRDNKT